MNLQRSWHQEDALWRVIDAFFSSAAKESGLRYCRGFSRQAMGDIAAAFTTRGVQSGCRLRRTVRDLVAETAASSSEPLKITSAHVRPYLERHFGQSRAERDAYVLAWIDRQFEDLALGSVSSSRRAQHMTSAHRHDAAA